MYNCNFQYAVILLALFVIQLTAGVIGFIQVKEHEGTLNKTVIPEIRKQFEKYPTDKNQKTIFDAIQTTVNTILAESQIIIISTN